MRSHSRYRNFLLLAAALLLTISVLSLGLKHAPILKKVEGWVVSLTAPALQGLHYAGRTIKGAWEGYFALLKVRQENLALKHRLEEYAQKDVSYQEALQALQRLEALLNLKRQLAQPVIAAHIIAYDPSLWSRCAMLDQGGDHGVKNGMPVMAAEGIVGRVVAAYGSYSKVMLIVDRNSGADAMVQRTRVRGILQGRGTNRCQLDYVPKTADVQPGDLVLASGLGGVYPKGLVFGKVSAVNKKNPGVFQEIEVMPAADLSALEEVLVVQAVNLAISEK